MDIKSRLIRFLKSKELSQGRFEKLVGLSNGYVNNLKDNIRTSSLKKITDYYPDLNTAWLLTGEGNMIKESKINIKNSNIRNNISMFGELKSNAKLINVEYTPIPLVPITARAGYLLGFNDMEYIEQLPTIPVITDRTYHGKYMCFEVDGDSMNDNSIDSLLDHDLVLCREIRREHWRSKLHINQWNFVIIHKEGIIIKRITEHDIETGTIRCHSLNSLYTDFELSLNDVYELYNVVKIVDRSARL